MLYGGTSDKLFRGVRFEGQQIISARQLGLEQLLTITWRLPFIESVCPLSYCHVPIILPYFSQLQARLERMERRLAILQKNSRSKYDIVESDSPQHLAANNSLENSMDAIGTTPNTPRIRTHRDSLINSEKHIRSRSNSKDRIARTGRSSRISSHAGTPTPQDVQESPMNVSLKRNAKRKLSDNTGLESSSKKKKSKQTEMRTRLEYSKLDLPVPYHVDEYAVVTPTLYEKSLANHLGQQGRRNSNDTATSAALSTVSGSSGVGGKGIMNGNDHENTIMVPSWRTYVVKPGGEGDPMDCEVSQ